ncbi:MAG: hypothetical protein HKN16_12525 [Saprospiraceae bacterium]|nr:hypothetical protein [Saprospiraceae bacterium]
MARKKGTITKVNAGRIDILEDDTGKKFSSDTARDWREEQLVDFSQGPGTHPETGNIMAIDVDLGFPTV